MSSYENTKEKAEYILDKRKLIVTSLLISETLTKACEVNLLNREKTVYIIDSCLKGEFSLLELKAISSVLNCLQELEKLNCILQDTQEERNRIANLMDLALELQKLNKVELSDNLLKELTDLPSNEWLNYMLTH